VAAIAANNTWAVGYSGNAGIAADRGLIEHWDGAQWTIVPSPNTYSSEHLYAVAAVSANDIWAVGQYFNQNPYRYGALIVHWNGSAWSAVANPATNSMYGVAALSSNNVWAIGESQVLHWNGSSWSIVPSPQAPSGSYNLLRAVSAVSASDIWAAGYVEIPSGEGYIYQSLIEHWDGSAWRVVPGAQHSYGIDDTLSGITSLSASSVWAVGVNGGLSFAERWNGTRWTRVASTNVGTSNNTFEAAAAIPATGDVWAVGEFYRATSPYQAQTLVERCHTC
jgi:hypothetical protein